MTDTSLSFSNPLADDRDEIKYWGLSSAAWIKIGIVSVLMIALFRFNLLRLWIKTNPFYGEANWGHAFCVPLIGLYYLYLNRETILHTEARPLLWGPFLRNGRLAVGAGIALVGLMTWKLSPLLHLGTMATLGGEALLAYGAAIILLDWGIGTLLFGILAFSWGIYPGQNDFAKDVGMVWTLFGVVLLLCGWQMMKTVWFPIVFLVCAIPWPQLAYSRLAGPLQELAATVAVQTLKLTGVTAAHSGTKIYINISAGGTMRTLNVAEACAGLRSLMTFIAVAGAVGFLSTRALWQKLVITVSAIPIANFCNVMRVAGQGLLDHYVSEKLSDSFAHQFVGLIMLIPAFFLILLVGWILDNMFVETGDVRHLASNPKPEQKAAVIANSDRGRALEDDLIIEVQRKPATIATAVLPSGLPTTTARSPAPLPAKATPQTIKPAPTATRVTTPVTTAPVTMVQVANPPVAKPPTAKPPVRVTPSPAIATAAATTPAPRQAAPATRPAVAPAAARPAAPVAPNNLAEATKRLTANRQLRPAATAPVPSAAQRIQAQPAAARSTAGAAASVRTPQPTRQAASTATAAKPAIPAKSAPSQVKKVVASPEVKEGQ